MFTVSTRRDCCRNAGPMESNVFLLFLVAFTVSSDLIAEVPSFNNSIANVTIPLGRDAVMVCVVDNLGTYKVAWLRVDTQTILTIHNHVITKNHRIGIANSDQRTWHLHIKNIKESDRGWYMCQINTDPMKSQIGFLEVVVPPDILDSPTSADMTVREGSNATLRCEASGLPIPNITWRREGGKNIPSNSGGEVSSVEGSMFNIFRVNRLHMGPYLCIASNGVPPSVSKRIMLVVEFSPQIWIQNQLIGVKIGQRLVLECRSEANPKSINYWTREKGDIIAQGAKYEPVITESDYKIHMKLIINSVSPNDLGIYKCVSKNSIGDSDGSIKVYEIPYEGKPDLKTKSRDKNRPKSNKKNSSNEIEDSNKYDKQKDKQIQGKEYDYYDDGSLTGNAVRWTSSFDLLSLFFILILHKVALFAM